VGFSISSPLLSELSPLSSPEYEVSVVFNIFCHDVGNYIVINVSFSKPTL
jgi:hypothetical protein